MKALIVDPEPESRDALRRAFDAAGVSARGVATATEGEKQLSELRPDALVVALEEGFPEGKTLLEQAVASDPQRAVYALVGQERLEDGVIAMARGARDFLWRPVSAARVAILLPIGSALALGGEHAPNRDAGLSHRAGARRGG